MDHILSDLSTMTRPSWVAPWAWLSFIELDKVVVAAWAQEGVEESSHTEGQEGQQEEIPLIQGKEQGLCFAGAAIKRYPMPKVRETQVKW